MPQGKQILSLDIRVEKEWWTWRSLMKAAMPNSAIQVQAMNDNVVLTGSVSSAWNPPAPPTWRPDSPATPRRSSTCSASRAAQQVMLKVRIAEMDRNIAKQFGVNLAGAAIVGGVPIIAVHLQSVRPGGPGAERSVGRPGRPGLRSPASANATVNPVIGHFLRANRHVATYVPVPAPTMSRAQLKALERVGLVHMLAEPNLTAVSGETAKFLAGGEFPVPAGRDRRAISPIEFKQFGVGLSFTPVVLAPGRISLQLSTRSQRTDQHRRLHLLAARAVNGTVTTGG